MKQFKRILALILAVCMVCSMLPAVSAADAAGISIDFTNPADAGKFIVDNQTVSEIREGEGFYMISTNEAFEDCKGQLSGDAATTPRDAVQVQVSGDWTATLALKVDTSGSNGQYEFICLYGMADYDNGCGIRAGNGSTVNYKEVGGVNESSIDGMKVQTGLTTGTDHWYRLEKEGTTYTGYLSENGTDFQKVFTYENTGIEAKMIVIDAYSGRSVGYQYWLQSLSIDGAEAPAPCEHDYEAVVTAPTCTEAGFTTYTCSKCGDSYTGDEVAALGHDFQNGVCTRCGAADPDYVEPSAFLEGITLNGEPLEGFDPEKFEYELDAADFETAPVVGAVGPTGGKTALLITGSDFQDPATSYTRSDYAQNGNYEPQMNRLKAIIGNIQESLGTAGYFIAGGDYNFDEIKNSVPRTNTGIAKTLEAVQAVCGEDVAYAVVQGNHDAPGSNYSPTGPCDMDDFGLFTITEEDYRSYPKDSGKWSDTQNSEAKAQAVADQLDAYLAEKAASGFDKPVFVACHVPIHYNTRTASKADAIYGDVIYKVLYKYGDDLNIIFLYGHNHAWGDDDYLGGASNFLTRGDTINIAKHGSQTEFTVEPVNFTYMNYGYTGYYWAKWVQSSSQITFNDAADSTLTMTAFEISGNQVTISRWDENGMHDLKSKGVASLGLRPQAEVCVPDVRVIGSPVTVKAPKNPSAGGSGLQITVEQFEGIPGTATITCVDPVSGDSNVYRLTLKAAPAADLTDIDFTDPASADRFTVVNPDVTAIREGQGLYLVSTRNSIESSGRQLTTEEELTPKDLILVPVSGDWTATLKVKFNDGGSAGHYEYLGFYAMDDYNNFVGMRAGDESLIDFLKVDGNETRATVLISDPNTSTCLPSAGTHWFRIAKTGTSYVCYWSTDGTNYTECFSFADTGIEPKNIMFDAYSGNSTGYNYLVEYLNFSEEVPAPCEHDYQAVVTAPTCTASGYTTYTCSKCGDSYVDAEVAALGHDFGEWAVTKAATCTAAGEETRTCARCGEKETHSIAATGHSFSAWVVTREATCTAAGEESRVCEKCGEKESREIAATGHDFGEWAVTRAATCTAEGEETRTCARCGEKGTRAIAKIAHNYVDGRCTVCGEADPSYVGPDPEAPTIDFTKAADAGKYQILGQTSSAVAEGVGLTLTSTMQAVETAGTHWEEGYDMLSGDDANTPVDLVKVPVEGDWVATLDFDFDPGSSQGYYEFFGFYAVQGQDYQNMVGIRGADGDIQDFIRRDGGVTAAISSAHINDTGLPGASSYRFRIEKTGDDYVCSGSTDGQTFEPFFSFSGTGLDADYLIIDAYSGMATGYTYTLKRLDIEQKAVCEHDYKTVVTEPTCTEGGYTTYTCSKCGKSFKGDETPALGHDFGDWAETKAATCTEKGEEARACSRCDVKETRQTDALGHDLTTHEGKAATCTEGGWAAYETCSRCDYTTYRELPALGHDLTAHVAKAPTCTEVGWNSYETCSRCDYTTYAEEPALGHSFGDWAVTKAATCTEKGEETRACIRCDAKETRELDKIAHDFKDGKCTVCGEADPDYKPPVVDPFRFDDVKDAGKFYFEPVYWAYEHEPQITKGTSEKLFSPDAGCTRGQVVTFLWRAMNEPEPESTKNPFEDVKEGAYYYKAVLWAVEKGITKGTSDTTFRPDQTCTRGQIVTFLYRAQDPKPELKDKNNPFKDVAESAYYYDAVLWAVENDITKGKAEGFFRPELTCTRGEIVTFLYRAMSEGES